MPHRKGGSPREQAHGPNVPMAVPQRGPGDGFADGDECCAICNEGVGGEHKGLRKITTGCGHSFHEPCIELWLQACRSSPRIFTCPVCRTELSETYDISPVTVHRRMPSRDDFEGGLIYGAPPASLFVSHPRGFTQGPNGGILMPTPFGPAWYSPPSSARRRGVSLWSGLEGITPRETERSRSWWWWGGQSPHPLEFHEAPLPSVEPQQDAQSDGGEGDSPTAMDSPASPQQQVEATRSEEEGIFGRISNAMRLVPALAAW